MGFKEIKEVKDLSEFEPEIGETFVFEGKAYKTHVIPAHKKSTCNGCDLPFSPIRCRAQQRKDNTDVNFKLMGESENEKSTDK